jgi:hypothetical protein
MKTAVEDVSPGADGLAALAIIKMLLEILQKKQLLSDEEIDIILNCAEVEVDPDNKTDMNGRIADAKLLISNLMNDSDDVTSGYSERTKL